eukprot:1189566-Prorocentrum_minimum.AAC.1
MEIAAVNARKRSQRALVQYLSACIGPQPYVARPPSVGGRGGRQRRRGGAAGAIAPSMPITISVGTDEAAGTTRIAISCSKEDKLFLPATHAIAAQGLRVRNWQTQLADEEARVKAGGSWDEGGPGVAVNHVGEVVDRKGRAVTDRHTLESLQATFPTFSHFSPLGTRGTIPLGVVFSASHSQSAPHVSLVAWLVKWWFAVRVNRLVVHCKACSPVCESHVAARLVAFAGTMMGVSPLDLLAFSATVRQSENSIPSYKRAADDVLALSDARAHEAQAQAQAQASADDAVDDHVHYQRHQTLKDSRERIRHELVQSQEELRKLHTKVNKQTDASDLFKLGDIGDSGQSKRKSAQPSAAAATPGAGAPPGGAAGDGAERGGKCPRASAGGADVGGGGARAGGGGGPRGHAPPISGDHRQDAVGHRLCLRGGGRGGGGTHHRRVRPPPEGHRLRQ